MNEENVNENGGNEPQNGMKVEKTADNVEAKAPQQQEMTTEEIIELGRQTQVLTVKQGGWTWYGNRNMGQTAPQVDAYLTKFPAIKEAILTDIAKRSRRLEEAGIKSSEDLVVITASELEKLIAKKVSEATDGLNDSLARMVNKIRGTEDKAVGIQELTEAIRKLNPEYAGSAKIYNEAEIDPDDYLEVPALYFTFMSYHAIWDKKKHGKDVNTPYGTPIRFNFYGANLKKTGTKYDEAIPIAMAKVQSKKEMNWLEDPATGFGKIFFKKASDAINADHGKMMFYDRARQQVATWGQGDIITRCKQRGLEISDDMDKMRDSLIDAIANELMKNNLVQNAQGAKTQIKGAIVN